MKETKATCLNCKHWQPLNRDYSLGNCMATERGDAFWMGFRGMIRENAGWTKDRTKPGDKCHAQRFLRVGSKGGEYTQAFEQALHPAQEL